jgi:aminoglycoside 6'-N-acetyltransferase
MKINFEPLRREHFALLLKWLNSPEVQEFWDKGTVWTQKSVEEKYCSYVEGYKLVDGTEKPINAFIIQLDGKPIGYIQYYPIEYNRIPSLKVAGLDIFLGEDRGMGIGPAAIENFLQAFIAPTYDGCLVDPDMANAQAGIHKD